MSPGGDRPASRDATIWTSSYMALCVMLFLTYVNHTVLMPVVPLYVRELGGTEFVAGVVLASFSIASFVLRPWIGRLVDDWDAGRVLLLGCVLLAAFTSGLAVPLVVVAVVASMGRGIAWAALNTGANALLAHLAPTSRRGEAAGYYALFQAAAATAGPPVALWWLARGGSAAEVIAVCAALAVLAALVSLPLRDVAARLRRPDPTPEGVPPDARAAAPVEGAGERPGAPRPRRQIIARSAVLPSVILSLVMFTQPAVFGFVPLYAEEIGVSAGGVTAFYVVSGVSALLGRSLLGRVSDRSGRGATLAGGLLLMGAALLLLLKASLVPVLLAVAALYSVGQGMALPALTALAIDRADTQRIGVAMATFSAAFQIGAGAGGLASGTLITTTGYTGLWLITALAIGVGLVTTIANWSQLGRRVGA